MPIILDRSMPENIKQNIGKLFNLDYIDSYALTTLPPPLCTHPDIQIHFLSPEIAICAPECYEYYAEVFGKNKYKLLRGSSVPGGTYPADTAYNIARVGNHVFANTRFAEPLIVDYYISHGFEVHHINQGYAKCSMCIPSENAVITEDRGIYKTLSGISDIHSLVIESGGVRLSGYDCGFIGGCSGLVNDTIVFTGRIPKDIRMFLDLQNIKYFEASDDELVDFGSIIYRR